VDKLPIIGKQHSPNEICLMEKLFELIFNKLAMKRCKIVVFKTNILLLPPNGRSAGLHSFNIDETRFQKERLNYDRKVGYA